MAEEVEQIMHHIHERHNFLLSGEWKDLHLGASNKANNKGVSFFNDCVHYLHECWRTGN